MDWQLALVIILISLIALMATGMPTAFVFLLIDAVGAWLLWGGLAGLELLILSLRATVSSFALLPIPMFVLMGELIFQSGLAAGMIELVDKWLGRLPGRLGLLAVGSATLFATCSGSQLATTAMLGRLLIPEMQKRGYKKPLCFGPIMGSGGLAMIIPPSGLAVLFAALAEISVGRLLLAGFIPGLIIASFYATYVVTRAILQPSIAPAYAVPPVPLLEKLTATVKYGLPVIILIFLVLGVIFLGIATPTEAAALGAMGCLVLAAVYRKLTWQVIKNSLKGTLEISVMTLMIITGAGIFSQVLVFTGITRGLVGFVTSLDMAPMMVIIGMQILVLFMGTYMSTVSIMMITIPIYMPIIYTLGFDPIWFGLVMLINIEMAGTTPPFGMLLFVMKGVAPPDTTMLDIIKSGFPFLLCDATVMALVIAFPILALWLPNMMF